MIKIDALAEATVMMNTNSNMVNKIMREEKKKLNISLPHEIYGVRGY